jgi:5-formaminoimidazole-4-carboxamide-1-(beta)-D-ribofuranosyl 5'-monophosphate synthetase
MSKKPAIAVMGSHSALDVCRGAKNLGFETIVVTEKGRGLPYTNYYKTDGALGCVDSCIELDKFAHILRPEVQQQLVEKNALFVPHRSFEVYVNNYDAIENEFPCKILGNKWLLRMEERNAKPNQYDLLRTADIRFPQQFAKPEDIDRLTMIKVPEKTRGYERAFFLASNFAEYKRASDFMIRTGNITEEALKTAVMEEFIVGTQVNLNFFYDPINKRLELLGTDTRRQTNLDGILRIPGSQQQHLLDHVRVKYEEAGHIAVTILESMLQQAFELGERFVDAALKMKAPGVIGPFGLQSMIVAGPPKKEFVVFDVSPRMPGSPGIAATPYSSYLHGRSLTAGERLALMVQEAQGKDALDLIVT